jgi:glycosyltransferase involved in cell wall biosynthesis
MNLEKILKEKGHDVAIYSMQYPENEKSEWSKYWPSNMSLFDIFSRPFGQDQVKKGFTRLIDNFHPDIVHLNNIHTQLSPIIARIAYEKGIRVVWTLHDTKLVCPCYTCMRNGKWCTECFVDKKAVIKHLCMPGSIPGAIIGYLEARKWNKEKLQKYCDIFLSPSQFMKDTCVAGGYDADKFRVICNFINVDKVQSPSLTKGNYYVYLGRVNEVKGVRTLCRAACQLDKKLIVIGEGELLSELRLQYKDCTNIEFKGQMDWNAFRHILEGARFMVLPAEWSENNPLTVIEAQSLGTPVLGARIGGITELIEEGVSGMTFISGDVEDLKSKILKMWNSTFDYGKIAKVAVNKYSSEVYYTKLMDIYNCR